MKKISIKYLVFLISALVVAGIAIVVACGPDYPEEEPYELVSPEISHEVVYRSFFPSGDLLYDYQVKPNNIYDFDSINSEEWLKFFDKTVLKQDLNYLLYKAPGEEIDSLLSSLNGNISNIAEESGKNSILLYPNKKLAEEFLVYLSYAKKCEPFSTFIPPDWYSGQDKLDPRKDIAAIRKLIDEGSSLSENSNSGFIKERYIFQVERLYFQSANYPECNRYYRSNKNNFKLSESIKFRAMGYASGALYKSNRFGESNYMYSVIYGNYPPMMTTAYFCFSPKEESDWNESLSLTKNNREKEFLWQLLGIYKDPLRAMKQIYQLNPKSDLLDLLLVRSINSVEGITQTHYTRDTTSNEGLSPFVISCAEKGNTNKPYLWDIASAYLSYTNSNFAVAREYLSKTLAEVKNDGMVKEQVHLIEIAMMIEEVGKMDSNFESRILKELLWLKQQGEGKGINHERAYPFMYDGIFNWAVKRLGEKYKDQGDLIKSHCLKPDSEASFYSNNSNAASMVAYMDKKDKTGFDEFVLSVYTMHRNDIFEFQAVDLMLKGKISEALQKFELGPGSGDGQLLGDPFLIHIRDCHDCDHEAPQNVQYTKLSFVKRMLELETKIKTDPINAPNYYFELANGFYNITYFGNERTFYQTSIEEYDFIDWDNFYFYGYSDDGNSPWLKKSLVFNCTKAKNFYIKAMELSKNPEFKAKCSLMAAKCEQNDFYLSRPKDYKGNFKSGAYFKQLKNNYSGTNYYKEIIKECGYFRTYLASLKK
jgi:hypothetical protein